jgi:hypothetical protein
MSMYAKCGGCYLPKGSPIIEHCTQVGCPEKALRKHIADENALRSRLSTLEQSNAVLVAALTRPVTGDEWRACLEADKRAELECGPSDVRAVRYLLANRLNAALAGHTAGVVCVPRDKLSLCAEFLECDSGFSGRQLANELRALLEGGK